MTNGMNNIRVDLGGDKDSDKTRIRRASVVSSLAILTPLYQSDLSFKDSVDKLVQAGTDLATAESQVNQLEATLVKARGSRDTKRNAYDKAHSVCAAKVESLSTIPEDVQSYGFAVLSKNAPGIVPPSDIVVKYDVAKGAIRVRVIYLSGKYRCAIEIGSDPKDPASFKRVDGAGMTRALHGYAAGTWWIRAATLSAKEQSDWFGPVAVLVK